MRVFMLICGLTLVALALLAPAARAAVKKPALYGEFAQMVKELKLTGEQADRVTARARQLAADLNEWDAKNKETIDKLAAELKAAREAKDKMAVKQANANMAAARVGRVAIDSAGRKEILALLTPEQQQAWKLYQFQTAVLKRFTRAKLTNEQTAKVNTMSEAALKEIEALPATDRKGRTQLQVKLLSAIETDVLTDEQRAALTAPKPAPANAPK